MENKNSCFQNKVKYVQQPGRGPPKWDVSYQQDIFP